MNTRIQAILSRDLNIVRFKQESMLDYNQRLLFSALSEWARKLIQGRSISDIDRTDDYNNVDIMYIQYQLTRIADALLKVLDCNSDWLEVDDTKQESIPSALATAVISELKDTDNIAEIQERRITYRKNHYVRYGNRELVIGKQDLQQDYLCVGGSRWHKYLSADSTECKRLIHVSGKQYYDYMREHFIWTEALLKAEYNVFVPKSKRLYSKSWEPLNKNRLREGLSIIRTADSYDPGYIMLWKTGDHLMSFTLDPAYKESNEIYRILYSLSDQYGIPAECKVNLYDDYAIVRLPSSLPDYENKLFIRASWPYREFKDRYRRVVPSFLWPTVKENLEFLGIHIVVQ